MSDPESALARWSRLKRERAHKEKETAATEAVPDPGAREQQGSIAAEPIAQERPAPAFNSASLPPIESIVASSDVRAFLQAGVPAALTRAALRRAWASDPAIRDFIEMAENQWDFANPASIPGFGPLTAADDIQSLVAKAMGKLGGEPTDIGQGYDEGGESSPARPTSQSEKVAALQPQEPDCTTANRPDAQDHRLVGERSKEDIASQHDNAEAIVGSKPSRRGHGRALPQ